ncbi:response regulator transcription factor [Erysipelothrix sp. D19-032]
MKILVIEDDKSTLSLIQQTLVEHGYDVDVAQDGQRGADAIEASSYDLIILDVMLPIHSGYDLLPMIKDYKIPVLMLTALGSIDDKIKAFDLGVEDYLTKPFEVPELLARVKVILRRYHNTMTNLQYKNIQIDLEASTVWMNGNAVSLTPLEYRLLLFLIENTGIALSREYLLESIRETDHDETRTLDLHIQRLRKKMHLETNIRTIFKFGYILDNIL